MLCFVSRSSCCVAAPGDLGCAAMTACSWPILARLCGRWRDVLHAIKPEDATALALGSLQDPLETKSSSSRSAEDAPEIVALIQVMTKGNVLWGERIPR